MIQRTHHLTVRPNHEIFVREWIVPSAKGVVVISHGLGEHSGRYDRMSELWTNAGYAVVAYDKGGHGLSTGKPGCIPDIEVYFEELKAVSEYCNTTLPSIPKILYGQSMGTTVGLAFLLNYPRDFQAMIGASGWLKLVKEPSWLTIKMAALLGPVFPGLTLSNGLDPRQISTLPDEASRYQEDPLVHDRISLALGNGIFGLLEQLHRFSGTFPVPLLLMHSQNDPITSWKGSKDFASQIKGNVSLSLLPKSYHELHHDVEASEIGKRQLEWLDEIGLFG